LAPQARPAHGDLVATVQESGSIFVHRNIANIVGQTDINAQAVLQYAVEVLKVKHIFVCGHYDCGGVRAALDPKDYGAPLQQWLSQIRDVYRLHKDELLSIADTHQRYNRLVELNILEQCLNVFKSPIVQKRRVMTSLDPAKKWVEPQVHGLVYHPSEGLLKELSVDFRDYFQQYWSIYSVYNSGKQERQPQRPTRPTLEADEPIGIGAGAIRQIFAKYSSEGDGLMTAPQFADFLREALQVIGARYLLVP
jgi:carbonic anhydrase